MRVLIMGCGYVGVPLGRELARRGHHVFGVRRTDANRAELEQAGIHPLTADVTQRSDLDALPADCDWVVNCVSSDRGGAEEYRSVYLDGTRHLLDWLRRSPPRKYAYTSSTSVYAQADGSIVTEASPAEPASETSRVLVETENLLLGAAREWNFPGVILRVAGIYGPGRGHLFQQYLKDEARLAGDGSRLINMIHVDDVAGAILAALERGSAGQIYNAADDEPVSQLGFFQFLSRELHKPMPPVETEANPKRKRGLTSKRVSNERLKRELEFRFKYPTYREGYREEIERVKRNS